MHPLVKRKLLLPNGRTIRGAFLLSLQLNLVKITRLLLQFIDGNENDWDDKLAPLWNTRWEYEEKQTSLIGAILLGAMSICGLRLDVTNYRSRGGGYVSSVTNTPKQ